jgi:hypothetical protein
MDDDMPKTRPRPAKPEPTQGLSEAELSRMAREAVHQPADSRIDKQLARMGLIDGEAADAQVRQPSGTSTMAGPEIDRLRKELRRAHAMLWVLIAVAAVLAVIVVVLLVR